MTQALYELTVPEAEAVPQELRERAQWVAWKLAPNPKADKPKKLPIAPRTGLVCNAHDPANWTDFETACRFARSHGYGIGFDFTPSDAYCGIDFDNCFANGSFTDAAVLEHVLLLNSYSEISPSGTGVKVFVKGRLSRPTGHRSAAIEMYDQGRFFTFTGRHIQNPPDPLESRQAEIDALARIAFPEDVLGATAPAHNTRPQADATTDRIPKGCRNDALLSKAGTMRRIGVPQDEIDRALLQINEQQCDPPLPESEVLDIAHRYEGQPPYRYEGRRRDDRSYDPQTDADTDRPSSLLPDIVSKGRPLADITADAVAVLQRANEPEPQLFQRDGKLVAIRTSDEGRPIIYELARAQVRGHLARAARFVVAKRKAVVDVPPPNDVVDDLMGLDPLPFPTLTGITEAPVLRPDGTVLTEPGYDAATGLFYQPPAGFTMPPISDAPSRNDINAALALLREAIGEFPFVDDASEANALGLLLTPIVRASIDGPTPLCLVDAPTQGTGKSLLVGLAATIATGAPPAPKTECESDAEWRKTITSWALEGTPFIFIDNVEMELKSGQLAGALTTTVWSDRLLSTNTSKALPLRTTWVATGNNLCVANDIGRRCYWVRMDAKVARPWMREGFRHPSLLTWAKERRGALLGALLTLARAWHVAGRPAPKARPIGSFEDWTRTVGGILEHASVDAFLGNLDEMYENADGDTAAWEAFLEALCHEYRGRAFTAAEVAKRLKHEDDWLDDTSDLRATLPDELAEALGKSGSSFQKRLSHAFRAKLDRRYGPGGFVIVRGGKDSHLKTLTWEVHKTTVDLLVEQDEGEAVA